MKITDKKLSLTSYDELFQTEEARQDDQRERVMEIPLCKLHHFHDHPFQVRHDQALQDMAESIKAYCVLLPGLVRPLPDGEYEVVSGNRRMEASILAGRETMPVIVRDITDDEAIIAMVDANLQRENILPSERAFAWTYPMCGSLFRFYGDAATTSINTRKRRTKRGASTPLTWSICTGALTGCGRRQGRY